MQDFKIGVQKHQMGMFGLKQCQVIQEYKELLVRMLLLCASISSRIPNVPVLDVVVLVAVVVGDVVACANLIMVIREVCRRSQQ